MQHAVEHDGSRGLRQGRQFAQRVLGFLERAAGIDADENDVLDAQLPVLDLGDVFKFGGQAGHPAQRAAVLALELVAVGALRLVESAWSACALPPARLSGPRRRGKPGDILRPSARTGEHPVDEILRRGSRQAHVYSFG